MNRTREIPPPTNGEGNISYVFWIFGRYQIWSRFAILNTPEIVRHRFQFLAGRVRAATFG